MGMLRLPLVVLPLLVFPSLLLAGDQNKPPGGASSVTIVVLKDDNGKPVRNAAVVLHGVKASGKQGKGGIELKTDAEGKTESYGVPYGLLRVQVIAPGFQTFGGDYNINQPEQNVTIRLKRPQEQYTIYNQPGSPPKDKQ